MKHPPASGDGLGPGLYVHVPFCEARCSYCDFYSVAWGNVPQTRFLDALEVEVATRMPADFSPRTVFIGGGTPSSLDDGDLARLLDIVGGVVRGRSPLREWSVENNPGSLTPSKAARMRAAGVTRLSIGVQSFDDAVLRSVGRVHDAEMARDAVAMARDVGFDHVSIDLLFAIPGQGIDVFRRDLETAVELGTDHVSAYALLYEEGTTLTGKLAAGLVEAEHEDTELQMMRLADELLGAAGFRRYEISNFARPGSECLHNMNYWRRGEYVGLGPSAASFLGGERSRNVASWVEYERQLLGGAGDAIDERERLDAAAAQGEALMLGLRMAWGVDLAELTRRYGIDAQERYGPTFETFADAGLLRVDRSAQRAALTRRGLELADGILASLLAVPAPTAAPAGSSGGPAPRSGG